MYPPSKLTPVETLDIVSSAIRLQFTKGGNAGDYVASLRAQNAKPLVSGELTALVDIADENAENILYGPQF